MFFVCLNYYTGIIQIVPLKMCNNLLYMGKLHLLTYLQLNTVFLFLVTCEKLITRGAVRQ